MSKTVYLALFLLTPLYCVGETCISSDLANPNSQQLKFGEHSYLLEKDFQDMGNSGTHYGFLSTKVNGSTLTFDLGRSTSFTALSNNKILSYDLLSYAYYCDLPLSRADWFTAPLPIIHKINHCDSSGFEVEKYSLNKLMTDNEVNASFDKFYQNLLKNIAEHDIGTRFDSPDEKAFCQAAKSKIDPKLIFELFEKGFSAATK